MHARIHQHHAHCTRLAVTELAGTDRHGRDQEIRACLHAALLPLQDSRFHVVINHGDQDDAEVLVIAKNLGSTETDATAPARDAVSAAMAAAGHTVVQEPPSPQ